ncbi:MAG: manganese catalase family protein [Oscillospiraceae bacterium]|nr:manganese catalase family protein [Oscillospiraceae bacterium]
MFKYNKFLEFPVNIKNKNTRLANIVATQYGGPNGELGASLRYLSQRYTMPDDVTKGLLTDIGTEELGHLEMVGTLVKQLSEGEPAEEWVKMNTWEYYADNGASVFPQSSQGSPFNAASIAVTGDPITNLFEDLAAEQKARAVYDNILRLSDDPDVNQVIRFLREREIVHFQRFGEANHTDSNRFLCCYDIIDM